jgi:hypothetical protein
MGELLGVAGVVAFLPVDGALVPDYLSTLPGSAASTVLASGLTCDGGFSHLIRFDTVHHDDPVPLSELAAVCLDAVSAEAVGIVVVAESAGLVGASRQRVPRAPEALRFESNTLQDWLTFTAEPAHEKTTVLITGIVARSATPPLTEHLRPLRVRDDLLGHLHAAVFAYRPVPRRTVALEPLVASLYEHQRLRTVLHLIDDARVAGAGESRLVRGLVWAAPIAAITAESP